MMKFEQKLQNNVDLLNEVLESLNEPILVENKDFIINDWSKNHLNISLNRLNKNRIPIEIFITLFDLKLSIANVQDIFEWDSADTDNQKHNIINLIKDILTSFILTTTCNKHTEITLYDSKGNYINTYNLTTSIGGFIDGKLKLNCVQKLFFPVYPHS